MTKPNYSKRVRHNNVYYFIGRKNLSAEEMDTLIAEIANDELKALEEANPFTIPKERRNIFANDLKNGLDFCTAKYGVAKEQIIKEAQRLFPGIRL